MSKWTTIGIKFMIVSIFPRNSLLVINNLMFIYWEQDSFHVTVIEIMKKYEYFSLFNHWFFVFNKLKCLQVGCLMYIFKNIVPTL